MGTKLKWIKLFRGWLWTLLPAYRLKNKLASFECNVFNMSDFEERSREIANRYQGLEEAIINYGARKKRWCVVGFCEACEKERRFIVNWKFSDGKDLNFREGLVCSNCLLNSRQRFVFAKVREYLSKRKNQSAYIFEQITPFYHLSRKKLEGEIIGSEYLGSDKKPGYVYHGMRHEDAMKLSFPNERFNIMISNDVFEHVPDFQQALREAFRVLKPSGVLLFTVPFHSNQASTITRALVEDGIVKHILPAQFHGNLLDEKNGSLVFHEFGWNLLKECLNAGFSDAQGTLYYSPRNCHFGKGGQLLFSAFK